MLQFVKINGSFSVFDTHVNNCRKKRSKFPWCFHKNLPRQDKIIFIVWFEQHRLLFDVYIIQSLEILKESHTCHSSHEGGHKMITVFRVIFSASGQYLLSSFHLPFIACCFPAYTYRILNNENSDDAANYLQRTKISSYVVYIHIL